MIVALKCNPGTALTETCISNSVPLNYCQTTDFEKSLSQADRWYCDTEAT